MLNEPTRLFKANPTIEEYLRLRRAYPDEEIGVATHVGLEFLLTHLEELEENGIDPALVAGTFRADEEAHADLSLLLMKKLVERKSLQESGASHIV
jgi:hypothetical protein